MKNPYFRRNIYIVLKAGGYMKTVKKVESNIVFNVIAKGILIILAAVILIPVWNVVVMSFSSSTALAEGNSYFWPAEFSLENYQAVLRDDAIIPSFMVSVAKTVIGVVTHVFFCSLVAYGMSKRYLKGRKIYTAFFVITMFFSGGMIPTYLLMKSLNLINSFWIYIIPAMFSYYDMIILMNFFRNVPDSLEESVTIDGGGPWTIFFRLILPLSKPALATIALFNGVGQWNDFFTAKLYISDKSLYPLQMKLYAIIVQQEFSSMQNVPGSVVLQTSSRGMQLATIVVTTVPIIIVYPMLQKYFVGGIMLGAVKE